MSQLVVGKEILEQMIAQAKAAEPVEACGILAGKEGRVEKFYEMTNVDKSSTHFTMEPSEQFSVIKDARANGLELLAIYHSHPLTPARPSQEDIRYALTPGATYVILSLKNDEPVIKGFTIENGIATEVPVGVTEE